MQAELSGSLWLATIAKIRPANSDCSHFHTPGGLDHDATTAIIAACTLHHKPRTLICLRSLRLCHGDRKIALDLHAAGVHTCLFTIHNQNNHWKSE